MVRAVEAEITINGVKLTGSQSMAVRVAVADMLVQLGDRRFSASPGPMGAIYRQRLGEVREMIILNQPATTPTSLPS